MAGNRFFRSGYGLRRWFDRRDLRMKDRVERVEQGAKLGADFVVFASEPTALFQSLGIVAPEFMEPRPQFGNSAETAGSIDNAPSSLAELYTQRSIFHQQPGLRLLQAGHLFAQYPVFCLYSDSGREAPVCNLKFDGHPFYFGLPLFVLGGEVSGKGRHFGAQYMKIKIKVRFGRRCIERGWQGVRCGEAMEVGILHCDLVQALAGAAGSLFQLAELAAQIRERETDGVIHHRTEVRGKAMLQLMRTLLETAHALFEVVQSAGRLRDAGCFVHAWRIGDPRRIEKSDIAAAKGRISVVMPSEKRTGHVPSMPRGRREVSRDPSSVP